MPRVLPSQVVQLIEQYYPQVKNKHRVNFKLDKGHLNECVSIGILLEKIPAELLNPPPGNDYIELISNIEILNYIVEAWKTHAATTKSFILKGDNGNPISIIHDILLKCPEEAMSDKAAGLEFIDDENFRAGLRLDLSSVDRALSNGEWKATTVLAGSITEALLLWAIKKQPPRQTDIDKAMLEHNIKEKDLNKWGLDDYNKVAHELAIIEKRTFTQVDLARGFRNYIHPGREVRNKEKCSIGTAHSGIAAVEFVIEDLSKIYLHP